MSKKIKKDNRDIRQISFSPILKYTGVFCVLTLVVILIGGAFLSTNRMKDDAKAALSSVNAQITQRVDESINLLESLASLPEFYDPDIAPIDKVKKLDQMSSYFGYIMMCFVDKDIIVYSDGSEPASLASRDYMQKLYATGVRQVTDSFATGADGITLNYTIAVPLFDKQHNITGSLFCAIYFDEIVKILESVSAIGNSGGILLGTYGQVMSSTTNLAYGESIMYELRSVSLIGTTADQIEEQLLSQTPGNYWSIKNGDFIYTVHQRIENTNWDILVTVNFWQGFLSILPIIAVIGLVTIIISIAMIVVLRHYIKSQMKVVDVLIHSVEDLEKRIYQDERPVERDLNEIISLTADGLSDNLTGIVTRSVFLKQAEKQLKNIDSEKITALCFVDMDNLKNINDTYGHNGGDIALKSIGYILREYEKKYDGIVCRYGGDEFVLLITGIDDDKELRSVLDELVLRLHSEVGSAGQHIQVQCSVGVSLYQPGSSLESLISAADEALYFVKQNGKGYYKIY